MFDIKWRVIIRWFKIFVFCWSFHENKVLVKYDIYKAVSSVSELCQKYTTSYTLDILHLWYITFINVLLYRNISAITFGLWWKFHVDMLLAVMVIIRFGIWPFFWDMNFEEIWSSTTVINITLQNLHFGVRRNGREE